MADGEMPSVRSHRQRMLYGTAAVGVVVVFFTASTEST